MQNNLTKNIVCMTYANTKMKGFSPRNLKYMRAFAAAWPKREIVQEVLAQLTWYHNLVLLEKIKTTEHRLWYAAKAYEHLSLEMVCSLGCICMQ